MVAFESVGGGAPPSANLWRPLWPPVAFNCSDQSHQGPPTDSTAVLQLMSVQQLHKIYALLVSN